MKLDIDFSKLDSARKNMGADLTEQKLRTGIVVDPADVVSNEVGVLNYKKYQVLLYIKDHGYQVLQTVDNPEVGRRYHMADCKTLKAMRTRERYERYIATNATTGVFAIDGYDMNNLFVELEACLIVCKNCLKHLNYKGYRTHANDKILNDFDLKEFFATYSSYFPVKPMYWDNDVPANMYSKDWNAISENVRNEAGWSCNRCKIHLGNYKHLLKVHHCNGLRYDNRSENLDILCIDCYSRVTNYRRIWVSKEERQAIRRLRKQQKPHQQPSPVISLEENWQKNFELVDPAAFGVLDLIKHANKPLPQIGYEVSNAQGEIIAELEIAWPISKTGIVLSKDDSIEKLESKEGWTVYTVSQALEIF